jgi:hypothetical protein
MPRSLSPDSPLLLNPPAAAPAAVASGGSVELQRLRSHVLALDALSSSGSSSSDEEREDRALLPLAAAAAAAASPQLASQAAPQNGADGGTSGAPAADSAAERTAGTAGHSDDVSGGGRAVPGCAFPALFAAEVRGPPGAAHAAGCQLVAAPPLIRHGAGALAGLLQSPDDSLAVETPTSPAERYRQAVGIHQCAVGGWANGAGIRSEPSADGVQLQQRWLLASGRQRQPDEGSGQPPVPFAEESSRDGDSGAQPAEQPRPPTPPAAEARRSSSGAAPSAGAMRSPPAPPSLPQVTQLSCTDHMPTDRLCMNASFTVVHYQVHTCCTCTARLQTNIMHRFPDEEFIGWAYGCAGCFMFPHAGDWSACAAALRPPRQLISGRPHPQPQPARCRCQRQP